MKKIHKIIEKKDILYNLQVDYEEIRKNYMTHILLTFDMCSYYYEMAETTSDISEKEHIEKFLYSAIEYVQKNQIVEDKENILNHFRKIHSKVTHHIKKENKSLSKSLVQEYLDEDKEWTFIFNKPKIIVPKNRLTYKQRLDNFLMDVSKFLLNYTCYFIMIASVGPFTYGEEFSISSMIAFLSSLVLSVIIQRVLIYINHELRAREDAQIKLDVALDNSHEFLKKITEANGYFDIQRFKTRLHLAEFDQTRHIQTIEEENKNLKDEIRRLKDEKIKKVLNKTPFLRTISFNKNSKIKNSKKESLTDDSISKLSQGLNIV